MSLTCKHRLTKIILELPTRSLAQSGRVSGRSFDYVFRSNSKTWVLATWNKMGDDKPLSTTKNHCRSFPLFSFQKRAKTDNVSNIPNHLQTTFNQVALVIPPPQKNSCHNPSIGSADASAGSAGRLARRTWRRAGSRRPKCSGASPWLRLGPPASGPGKLENPQLGGLMVDSKTF